MREGQFYRYELSLHGEKQGMGFLTGLEDVGLPLSEESMLYDPFEELKSPSLPVDENTCYEFWFTEQGNERYASAIAAVENAINPLGWDLICLTKMANSDSAIYIDPDQVAWRCEK